MSRFGFRKIQDLPETIAVFPLAGALLFPRGALPLNIFEPRYLNMVDDALASDRVIGMIQPANGDPLKPPLSAVGTLGRISAYAETGDGRYLITLSGVCRFRVKSEIEAGTPYRQVAASYDEFVRDLRDAPDSSSVDKKRLADALARYGDAHGFKIDWTAVDEAQPEALVDAVATLCPFDAAAKQALLEAPNLVDRAAALIAILELDSSAREGPESHLQ